MFEGGTNFGFMNGANSAAGSLLPVPTSYDYDAPLTESGNYTKKFVEIQKVIRKYAQVPPGPLPEVIPSVAHGKVKLEKVWIYLRIREYSLFFSQQRMLILSSPPLL